MMRAIRRYPKPKERYERFQLNPESPLYNGLIFAVLGPEEEYGSNISVDKSPFMHKGVRVQPTERIQWHYDGVLGRHVIFFIGNYVIRYASHSRLGALPHAQAGWVKTVQNTSAIGIMSCGNPSSGVGITMENHAGGLRGWFNNVVIDIPGLANGQWRPAVIQRRGTLGESFLDGGAQYNSFTHSRIGNPFDGNPLRAGSWDDSTHLFNGYLADALMFSRALMLPEIQSLADPSNVDLRVGGVPLIIPERPRLWAVGAAGAIARKKTPWHLLAQGAK